MSDEEETRDERRIRRALTQARPKRIDEAAEQEIAQLVSAGVPRDEAEREVAEGERDGRRS